MNHRSCSTIARREYYLAQNHKKSVIAHARRKTMDHSDPTIRRRPRAPGIQSILQKQACSHNLSKVCSHLPYMSTCVFGTGLTCLTFPKFTSSESQKDRGIRFPRGTVQTPACGASVSEENHSSRAVDNKARVWPARRYKWTRGNYNECLAAGWLHSTWLCRW